MAGFRRIWPIMLIMIGIFALAPPAQAQTSFAVRATSADGSTIFFTVFDGDPGDLNPSPNAITVVAGAGGVPVVGGFDVLVETSVTNTPGAPNFALLDLTFTVAATAGGAGGIIRLESSATGFTQPPPAFNPVTLFSAIGGTTGPFGTTVTAQQWLNTANLLFGLGAFTPGVQGPFGGGAFADEDSVTGNITGTFSLTERVTVDLAAGGIATGDLLSTATGIPEPTSVLLALTGLPFVGAYLRRRLKKKE